MTVNPWEHRRNSDPWTSDAAAHQLSDKETMMRKLLVQFQGAPFLGLTAEEAADACGFTAEDGAWKRVSDLVRLGWLAPTGDTRPGRSGRQQRVLKVTVGPPRETA